MAAKSFAKYFESLPNETELFHFKDFFQSLPSLTPTKTKLCSSGNIRNTLRQAQDCIVNNLHLNTSLIEQDCYFKEVVEPLYQLLKEITKEPTEDQIAQIIFMLHVSKTNLSSNQFSAFFFQTKSIRVTAAHDKCPFDEKGLSAIKKNSIANKIVDTVVKMISGKENKINLESLNLVYFESIVNGLNGFAGINQIYISNSQLQSLYFSLVNFSTATRRAIIQLNFIRLFLHEATHVALRSTLEDYNVSSPPLYAASLMKNEASAGSATSTVNPKFGLIEAGVLAEKELFGCRIDWKKSNLNINSVYLNEFLSKFLNEEEMEFDIKMSGVCVNYSEPICMAIDMIFEEEPPSFEI